MITQSGCFGSQKPFGDNGVIDNVAEVSATVDDIMDNGEWQQPGTIGTDAAFQLDQLLAAMQKRLRLLTWAVVAIAVVLIVKEVD